MNIYNEIHVTQAKDSMHLESEIEKKNTHTLKRVKYSKGCSEQANMNLHSGKAGHSGLQCSNATDLGLVHLKT